METNFNNLPFGFIWEGSEIIIVEEEAALIRQIYDLYTNELWSPSKIARHFNEQHILSSRGGKWDHKYVKYVLNNSFYRGRIIEPELFDKTAELFMKRLKGEANNRSDGYVYSNIVRCGVCGEYYTGRYFRRDDKIYISYRCRNRNKKLCDNTDVSQAKIEQHTKIEGLTRKEAMEKYKAIIHKYGKLEVIKHEIT